MKIKGSNRRHKRHIKKRQQELLNYINTNPEDNLCFEFECNVHILDEILHGVPNHLNVIADQIEKNKIHIRIRNPEHNINQILE